MSIVGGITVTLAAAAAQVDPLALLALCGYLPAVRDKRPHFFAGKQRLQGVVLHGSEFVSVQAEKVARVDGAATLHDHVRAAGACCGASHSRAAHKQINIILKQTDADIGAGFQSRYQASNRAHKNCAYSSGVRE